MSTNVFGPNDHHLELDEASGRYIVQPGLGADEEKVIRSRRTVLATDLDVVEARATTAEQQLAEREAEIARLRAELAATKQKPRA